MNPNKEFDISKFAIFDKTDIATGIYHVDLDTQGDPVDFTIAYCNQAMADLDHNVLSDLIGKQYYSDLYPNGNREWLGAYYKAAYFDETAELIGYAQEVNKRFRIKVYPFERAYCLVYLQYETDRIVVLEERAAKQLNMLGKVMHAALWSMTMDAQGMYKHTYGSKEFRELLGFKNENDYPTSIEGWFEYVHPADRVMARDAFYKAMDDVSHLLKYEIELRVLARQSEYRWFKLSAEIVRRDDGVPMEFLCAFVDVNDKYEADYMDSLTGGLNRKGFLRDARRIIDRTGKAGAYGIVYFNIKNFKAINTLFGFDAGDSLLRYYYQYLTESELNAELIARLEADHFVCLIPIEDIKTKVIDQCLEGHWSYKEKMLGYHGRCGIYIVEDLTLSIEGMIDCAKIAKKYVEDEQLRRYAFFDAQMRDNYVDQAKILAEFETSLQKHDYQVYYQPLVDAISGELVSAEALVRLTHPDQGYVSPEIFVPALEQNGYITRLDQYVVKSVYDYLEARYSQGFTIVPVSINLSWLDFYDEDMLRYILLRLKNSSLPKGSVRYEVTETSFAALEKNNMAVLNDLRQYGAMILLDNFGRGYSSFGMLKNYNFDILKIDMSYVQQIEKNHKARNIIRGIIDMCHKIGICVVAEGVETQKQVDFLGRNNCDFLQGYYYSNPICAQDFSAYIDKMASVNKVLRKDVSGEQILSEYKAGFGNVRDCFVNTAELVHYLKGYRMIFDMVRLFDGDCLNPITISEEGDLNPEPKKCYDIWHRERRCSNCTTIKAFLTKKEARKIVVMKDDVYQIISKYVDVDEKPYVIELAAKIRDGIDMEDQVDDYRSLDQVLRDYNEKIYCDVLTGVYNRRFFEEQVCGMTQVSAIALADLDYFKQINDHYGHYVGDLALQCFANTLKSCVRKSDMIIRVGGDEFVIVFQGMKKEYLFKTLENIRKRIEEIRMEDYPDIKLSMTIGGLFCNGGFKKEYLDFVDDAMYRAKKRRNAVEILDFDILKS